MSNAIHSPTGTNPLTIESTHTRRLWLTPTLLLLLGSVSVLFGAAQLHSLHLGLPAKPSPDVAMHFFAMPLPIVVHIILGTTFNLLAPWQFAGGIRQKYPMWHRVAGGTLALCVVGVAVSSLWMNHFYPPYGGDAKYWGIVAHNLIALGALGIALHAIASGSHNAKRHSIAMMCVVAVMLSPATQRVMFIPWFVITGVYNDALIGAVIWVGLFVNLAFVALLLHQRAKKQQA